MHLLISVTYSTWEIRKTHRLKPKSIKREPPGFLWVGWSTNLVLPIAESFWCATPSCIIQLVSPTEIQVPGSVSIFSPSWVTHRMQSTGKKQELSAALSSFGEIFPWGNVGIHFLPLGCWYPFFYKLWAAILLLSFSEVWVSMERSMLESLGMLASCPCSLSTEIGSVSAWFWLSS